MPAWGQLMFQDAASSIMQQMATFHDHALLIVTLVVTVVGYALIALSFNRFLYRYLLEAQGTETMWTIIPAILLVILAVPSLHLLYMEDEVSIPSLTMKAIGHQWYWSYEYSDFTKIEMDSYMVPMEELSMGDFRLLEVDNRVVLPMLLEIRVLVTAADVIHSWTVPSMGVKVDAIPGRLNQVGFTAIKPGVFYGQCSEICGVNHSFMPIVIEVVNSKTFLNWATTFNP